MHKASLRFLITASLALCGCLMHVQTRAQAPQTKPVAKVSCIALNEPVDTVHHFADGHAVLEEADDWRVNCKIVQGDKTIWNEDLPLAHPTPYQEAMSAIDKFRKEDAPKILKKLKEKS